MVSLTARFGELAQNAAFVEICCYVLQDWASAIADSLKERFMDNLTRSEQIENLRGLEADRQQLARAQPELARGLEAFRTSYAAYQKMTEQFGPPSTALAEARSFKST